MKSKNRDKVRTKIGKIIPNECQEFLEKLDKTDLDLLLRSIKDPPHPNEKMKEAFKMWHEKKLGIYKD